MTRLIGRAPVLRCLVQGKGYPSPQERCLLNIQPRAYAHIREITMGTEDNPWLFARTVIPMSTLKGNSKRLIRMDKTPLGKILFGRTHAKRKNMRLDLITADQQSMVRFGIPKEFPLWRRCSTFELSTGPLIINEVFLPDCPIYSVPYE